MRQPSHSSARDTVRPMRFQSDFLRRYLQVAPAALAIERSLECDLLAAQDFQRPVLDIGCGDGVFAAVLFADKIDLGIDYDPAEIARARGYERYDALVVCGGNDIPRPDASFRTIFSNSVLEHIPDLLPVLREAHRLLAPGGRFYVTIPTDQWERNVLPARLLLGLGLTGAAKAYGRWYNRFWNHYHAYPVERWRALFAEAGFRVAEQKTYAPANVTTSLDTLTAFALPSLFTKRLLGRWILAPGIRKAFVGMAQAPLSRFVAAMRASKGSHGFVFFALTK